MLEGFSNMDCIAGEIMKLFFLQEAQGDASLKISPFKVSAAVLEQVEGGESVNRWGTA